MPTLPAIEKDSQFTTSQGDLPLGGQGEDKSSESWIRAVENRAAEVPTSGYQKRMDIRMDKFRRRSPFNFAAEAGG